LQEAHF